MEIIVATEIAHTIGGGRSRGAIHPLTGEEIRAKSARKAAQKAAREAGRAEAEGPWSVRMDG